MEPKYAHAMVIDKQGYKVEFVRVDFIKESEGVKENPHGYTLAKGESLIYEDISQALSMIRPHWTGSEWEETGTIEITPEIMEQLRSSKLQDVNTACQQIIYSGIDVETSEGVKHFSLTEHDQTELLGLTAQVKEGTLSVVPYHADGELCKPWSVAGFIRIAESAQAHIFYHRTYCNHLRAYIKRIDDYEELKDIFYGIALPDDLQESINALIGGAVDA